MFVSQGPTGSSENDGFAILSHETCLQVHADRGKVSFDFTATSLRTSVFAQHVLERCTAAALADKCEFNMFDVPSIAANGTVDLQSRAAELSVHVKPVILSWDARIHADGVELLSTTSSQLRSALKARKQSTETAQPPAAGPSKSPMKLAIDVHVESVRVSGTMPKGTVVGLNFVNLSGKVRKDSGLHVYFPCSSATADLENHRILTVQPLTFEFTSLESPDVLDAKTLFDDPSSKSYSPIKNTNGAW